jgi:hypothetical protein
MESSTLNSAVPLTQIDTTWPSGLSSFAVHTTKFSFYLLSVAGFLVLVISGLVLIQTQFALKAIAEKNSRVPTLADRKSGMHAETDAECARNQCDLEATAVMGRARHFALFGPLPSVLTMIAVPVSLHLNSVGDAGVRVLLSVLLITIIHCANACTIQTYFSLIGKETRISFGSEVCSARDEKMRSGYLMRTYLTVLFVSSFVQANAKAARVDATDGWALGITYSPLPFTLARLSEDFSDTDSMSSRELARLV